MDSRWWRGHRRSYLPRIRERRHSPQEEEEVLAIKGWGYLKIFGMIVGGISLASTLLLTGYQFGQGHARAEVASEISDLKEQIRKQNDLLSSALTLRVLTMQLPLLSVPENNKVNIEKELEVSFEDRQKTPLIVIRRADDKVEMGRHKLRYYDKPYILRYWVPGDSTTIAYLFSYKKAENDYLMTVEKVVRMDIGK
jgi:hypothetical protein